MLCLGEIRGRRTTGLISFPRPPAEDFESRLLLPDDVEANDEENEEEEDIDIAAPDDDDKEKGGRSSGATGLFNLVWCYEDQSCVNSQMWLYCFYSLPPNVAQFQNLLLLLRLVSLLDVAIAAADATDATFPALE